MPSRRSVLVSGGGLIGASIGAGPVVAVPGIGDAVDCDDETELVTARRGNEAIDTENVSTAWNEHRQHVRATREAFQAEYPLDGTEWLRSIGITAIDEPVCDMRQMAITVGVDDLDAAEEKLGETYRDVPLVIEEAGDVELQGTSGANPGEPDYTGGTRDSDQRDDGSADDPDVDALPGFDALAGVAGIAGVATLRNRR